MVGDMAAEELYSESFGLMGAASGLATILGPLAGYAIAYLFDDAQRAPFVASALFECITLVVAAFWVRQIKLCKTFHFC